MNEKKMEIIEKEISFISEYMLKRVAEEHENNPEIDFFYSMADFLNQILSTFEALKKD